VTLGVAPVGGHRARLCENELFIGPQRRSRQADRGDDGDWNRGSERGGTRTHYSCRPIAD